MTILITGSRGKTALPLAQLLEPTHKTLVASRSPDTDSPNTVHFDWTSPQTYSNPFTHPLAIANPIKAIYLVGADVQAISTHIIDFIHVARKHSVNRFVMLSAWEIEAGDDILMGRAHAELKRLGDHEGVEWTVLRPHFFMENFVDYYLNPIKIEGKLYTASGSKGKKAYISARDIAAVAHRVLVDGVAHNRDYILTGPEAFNDEEVAEAISRATGREIECVELSEAAFKQQLSSQGLGDWIAEYLARLDGKVAAGLEIAVTEHVLQIVGRAGRTLEQFVEDNREVWL